MLKCCASIIYKFKHTVHIITNDHINIYIYNIYIYIYIYIIRTYIRNISNIYLPVAYPYPKTNSWPLSWLLKKLITFKANSSKWRHLWLWWWSSRQTRPHHHQPTKRKDSKQILELKYEFSIIGSIPNPHKIHSSHALLTFFALWFVCCENPQMVTPCWFSPDIGPQEIE